MTDVFDGGDADFDDSAYALDGEDADPSLHDASAGTDDPDDEGEGGEKKPEPDAKTPLTSEQLQARERQKTVALRQERQRSRSLEERLRTLEAAKPAEGAQADDAGPRPDPKDDPLAYLDWIDKRFTAAEARTQAQQATQQQQAQTQAQVNDIKTRVEEYETDFRETTPDYDTAADHYLAARLADMVATGMTEAAAQNAVGMEVLGITARAMAAGKDPAEVVYGLAKHRGYTTDQTAEAEGKLDTVRAAQKAASPLSGPGGRPSGDLNIGSINNLKGKAFDDAAKKLEDRMIRMERGF